MEMSMKQPLFSASDLYVKVSLYSLITGGEQLFEGETPQVAEIVLADWDRWKGVKRCAVPVKGSERNDWYVRNLGGEAKVSTQVQGESSRLTARGSRKDSNAP